MTTATKIEYRTPNAAITGMSDDDFYGRQEAIGVDLDACRRAAIQAVRSGLDGIIHGNATIGKLRVQIARVKLAIAFGNESIAATYLGSVGIPVWLGGAAKDVQGSYEADKAELAKAVGRKHPHPALAAKLAELEAELAVQVQS